MTLFLTWSQVIVASIAFTLWADAAWGHLDLPIFVDFVFGSAMMLVLNGLGAVLHLLFRTPTTEVEAEDE